MINFLAKITTPELYSKHIANNHPFIAITKLTDHIVIYFVPDYYPSRKLKSDPDSYSAGSSPN